MSSAAAQARAIAAQVVQFIRDGRSLDDALPDALNSLAPSLLRERALIQELTYGAIRWFRPLQTELQQYLRQPIRHADRVLESLLLIGLYQLRHMRIAPYAAVNETVEAVTELDRPWARKFANAILRRAQRESSTLDVATTHPDWLHDRIRNDWGDAATEIFEANLMRPPLTLRVNLDRVTLDAYRASLAASGVEAKPVDGLDAALILETPVPVHELNGFGDGLCSVQDAAAQLAAELLDVKPGMRVLDACAAPGGKAAHILERTPDARLVAVEIDPDRSKRIEDNFSRLGRTGAIRVADVGSTDSWWDGQRFDRILLDAPCSGTGVIRRHPDILLHRRPEDIRQVVAVQKGLLDRLWPLLATGGKLLYVTCSVLSEENEAQAIAFAGRHTDARLEPLSHKLLNKIARSVGAGKQVLPGVANTDGFYYAAWTRESTIA